MELSHLDEKGQARMVDVGAKPPTERMAVARCEVRMAPATLRLITEGKAAKGDVFSVSRVAGIMAAKRTPELIPLCHPVPISSVSVEFSPRDESSLGIEATVRCVGQTGVEMEAMTAACVAALTVYDMVKGVDKGVVVDRVRLVEKRGGRSGHYRRDGEEAPPEEYGGGV
jgi:cyclic pyranopterin phosphate synthase